MVLGVAVLSLATAASAGPPTAGRKRSDGVVVYQMQVPPPATVDNVPLRSDGYGSSLYPVAGSSDEVYGLTDRGPNLFLPDGTVVEPVPSFQPAIGKFRLHHGEATLERTIPLTDGDGTPYSGRVNSGNPRGQRILDLAGAVLPDDPEGGSRVVSMIRNSPDPATAAVRSRACCFQRCIG